MINYDKYLTRLRTKRISEPEYGAYRRALGAVAENNRARSRTLRGGALLTGMSPSDIASTDDQFRLSQNQQIFDSFESASRQRMQRIDEIDNRMDGLEMRKDEQNEQRRIQKQQQKNSLLKAGLSIGGAALGGLVGTIAGPGGTMAGAQIGSALGGMAGGFVGGNGKMALNYIDPAEVMGGLQDTISGISSALSLRQDRNDARGILDFVKNYPSKADELMMILKFGDRKLLKEYIARGA